MTRFKDFDEINAAAAEAQNDNPSFKLGGATFSCVNAPKAINIAKLSKAGQGDVEALIDYLRLLVVPQERDQFTTVLDSDEIIIKIDDLADLVTWLSEQYTGRPTK